MGFDKLDIYRRMSETEQRNQERFEQMQEVVKKFIEEVEEYKGLVGKVAEEFKALKDKLSGAVDAESWKAVSAVVAELDGTNAKLSELMVEKAPDPAPVVEAPVEEPAPVDTPIVE
jgi:isocitrate dehydrogenase kinase/phosphatase